MNTGYTSIKTMPTVKLWWQYNALGTLFFVRREDGWSKIEEDITWRFSALPCRLARIGQNYSQTVHKAGRNMWVNTCKKDFLFSLLFFQMTYEFWLWKAFFHFTLRSYWFEIKILAGTICVIYNPDNSDEKGIEFFCKALINVIVSQNIWASICKFKPWHTNLLEKGDCKY